MAAAAPNPVAPANSNQLADLWNKTGTEQAAPTPQFNFDTAQLPGPNSLDEHKLREMAQSDPSFLRNLIQRYESERKPEYKEAIKSVLSTIQKPEVLAFFARMAASNDPAQRREGFSMLQQMAPDSPEMRTVVRQALTSEQNPEVLAQAVAALQPAVVEPAESEAIIAQLRSLTQHPDPTVRTQSVLQLAQWDKNGTAQDRLVQAMHDAAPEVRQAAVFAAVQSGSRSDTLKAALLAVINSPTEARDIKGSALQALERFSLTKEEYASYTQVKSQIGL